MLDQNTPTTTAHLEKACLGLGRIRSFLLYQNSKIILWVPPVTATCKDNFRSQLYQSDSWSFLLKSAWAEWEQSDMNVSNMLHMMKFFF